MFVVVHTYSFIHIVLTCEYILISVFFHALFYVIRGAIQILNRMNYGRTPSIGTPSVYSHVTSRSTANLRSSRSLKSLKIPWYRRPIVQDAYFLDIQRGSLLFACYSLVNSFTFSFKYSKMFEIFLIYFCIE